MRTTTLTGPVSACLLAFMTLHGATDALATEESVPSPNSLHRWVGRPTAGDPGEPPRGHHEPLARPMPPPGATGSVLHTVVPQSTGLGRAVAIDAASGHLYYSLYLSASAYIYKVDLGGVELAQLLTFDCLGGPLAWDETTGTLWAMNYLNPAFGLYQLDPTTGNTTYSCDIRATNPTHPAVNGALSIGYAPDGLDYDPATDSFWASSEYDPPNWVVQLDRNCNILSAFQPVVRGGEGSSGVAVGPDGLWLAYPGGQTLTQVDLSGTPSGVQFFTGGLPEDLEYDAVTFAPLCAVWANEIANSRMTAYEVPCPPCGNGAVEGREQCDDGNSDPTDLCAPDCTFTTCGDGVIQTPNGVGTGGSLGDGVESCDDGGATARCNADCTLTTCGDGVVQTPNGTGSGGPASDGNEQCDDGNADPTDLCASDCSLTTCGDGIVQTLNGDGTGGTTGTGDEECDDGNADPTDQCAFDCSLTTCGDGIVQTLNGDGTGGTTGTGDEECDDANQTPGDGCHDCVLDSCAVGGIGPIALLLAIESSDSLSVVMSWRPDVSADGYNVWYVPAKEQIPAARQGGPGVNPSGCGPTGAASCWHFGAVPAAPSGPLHYYQIRGVCGATEAAE